MQVRYKLDTCGIKLKLAQWNHLSREDCQALVDRPCTSPEEIQAYRDFLQQLVVTYTGTPASDLPIDPSPEWANEQTIPASVQAKATEAGARLHPTQWASLTPLQRFALIKLSRSGHENANFLPALKEFKLIDDRE